MTPPSISQDTQPHIHPTLPIEVQYSIIDHLHSDSQTLTQCSLVCALWRKHSYKHKFMRNDFSARAVIPSVRSIHIKGPPNAIPLWDVQKMAAIDEVIKILAATGNIIELSLQNMAWVSSDPRTPYLALSGLSTISTLELLQVNFYARMDLVALFSNFPRLRHLVLEDVDCGVFSPDQGSQLQIAIPAGSYGLALRCCQDFSLQKRLRWDSLENQSSEGSESGASVEELANMAIAMSKKYFDVGDLLPTFGCSLHRLQLAAQTIHTYPDVVLHQLDLSHTTSLKQLSLGSSKRVLTLLPWVPALLCQLPVDLPTLTHLQIAFLSSRQFHLDKPILLFIADILSRAQFQNLVTIHFAVFDATGDRELMRIVKHTICEVFSRWNDRKALAFTFTRQ